MEFNVPDKLTSFVDSLHIIASEYATVEEELLSPIAYYIAASLRPQSAASIYSARVSSDIACIDDRRLQGIVRSSINGLRDVFTARLQKSRNHPDSYRVSRTHRIIEESFNFCDTIQILSPDIIEEFIEDVFRYYTPAPEDEEHLVHLFISSLLYIYSVGFKREYIKLVTSDAYQESITCSVATSKHVNFNEIDIHTVLYIHSIVLHASYVVAKRLCCTHNIEYMVYRNVQQMEEHTLSETIEECQDIGTPVEEVTHQARIIIERPTALDFYQ